jgi:hypothetical protein
LSEDWDRRPAPIDDPTRRLKPSWRSVRNVLLVGGALTSVVIAVGIAILIWVFTSHPASREAGREFARGMPQAVCVPETYSRLELCTSVMCAQGEGVFLGECLSVAARDPETCDGVPDELLSDETYAWAKNRCRDANAPEPYCFSVLGSLIGHCLTEATSVVPAD